MKDKNKGDKGLHRERTDANAKEPREQEAQPRAKPSVKSTLKQQKRQAEKGAKTPGARARSEPQGHNDM